MGFASEDRIFANDIKQVAGIIKDFSFVDKVNAYAASKHIALNEGYDVFRY